VINARTRCKLTGSRTTEPGTAVTCALQGDYERLGRHAPQLPEAQAQRAVDEAGHLEVPAGGVDLQDLELVAYVEVGIRRDHAADEGRDGCLAVERMGPMDDQPRLESAPAGLVRVKALCRRRYHCQTWS
jgi:hypothetical protein